MAVAFDWLNDTNLTISDTAEAIYTNAASTTTFIGSIYLHNSHSGTVEVTLYCVPDSAGSAGTAAAGNEFFKQTLAVDEDVVINDHCFILGDTGDTIQAVAGTANVVNIFLSGAKQT